MRARCLERLRRSPLLAGLSDTEPAEMVPADDAVQSGARVSVRRRAR
jgi:hypothetical protein